MVMMESGERNSMQTNKEIEALIKQIDFIVEKLNNLKLDITFGEKDNYNVHIHISQSRDMQWECDFASGERVGLPGPVRSKIIIEGLL